MNKPYAIQLELYENAVKMTDNTYVQGDAGVYPLAIQLLSHGEVFPISPAAVVSIYFKNEKTRTVNRGIAETTDAAAGALTYRFLGGELALDGETTASVVVQDGDARLTWQKFRFSVEKSLDDGKTLIPGPYVPWTAQIDAEISKIKQAISRIDGGAGGSAFIEIENGKLIIDGEKAALDADSVGGIPAEAIAKKSDLPNAADLTPPVVRLTNLLPNPATFTDWKFNAMAPDKIENGVATMHNTHNTATNPTISRPSMTAADPAHIYFTSWRMRGTGGRQPMLSIYNNMTPDIHAYTPTGRWCRVACAAKFAYGFGSYAFGVMPLNEHVYTPGEYTIEFSEPMIIDLTAAFGAGNEPDTNWCVNHIPFFEGTKAFSAARYTTKNVLCIGDSNTANGVYSYVHKLGQSAANGGFSNTYFVQGGDVMSLYSAPALTDAMISGDLSAQIQNAGTAEFKNNTASLAQVAMDTLSYVTIAYGTNDFDGNVPLGTEDMTDETKTTLKGAMRYVIRRWQTERPNVKLLFITPGWRTDKTASIRTFKNAAGLRLEDYVNAMIAVCAYYNVPVVDLYHGGGVNDHNAGAYLWDGLHGSDAYHEMIAKKVAEAMAEN